MLGWRIFGVGLSRRQLTQKGVELAEAIRTPVRELSERASRMQRAEGRGYIRAKTTPILAAQLSLLARQGEFSARELSLLADDVAERVVRLVLDDVTRAKPRAAYRRAA